MHSNIIFIAILISNCYALVYRKSYQDQTSWSFQHPTTTYKQARFGANDPKFLATYPISTNTDRDVCNAQCAMFCNKIECCNVATCQFNQKQCKAGYYGTAHTHIPTYDPNGAGKLFLVKDIGLWQTKWQGTFQQAYSNGHSETTTVECDGSMSGWSGGTLSQYLPVNGEGVPHPDSNYQGWYYRQWDRDAAWEYWRFTSSGEFEIHHFCTDGCSDTSPLGSPNFCCSAKTPGAVACDAEPFEFEEMTGNGYCTDSNNGDAYARMYHKRMSHEEARRICENDKNCVAYTYSLDYMNDSNNVNTIIYSSSLCTNDCSNTQWQDNPFLIKQASNIHDHANWRTAKCYRKKSLADC